MRICAVVAAEPRCQVVEASGRRCDHVAMGALDTGALESLAEHSWLKRFMVNVCEIHYNEARAAEYAATGKVT